MANLEDKMNLYNRYPDLWMDVNVSICRNFIVCLIPQSFYIAQKFWIGPNINQTMPLGNFLDDCSGEYFV